MPDELAGVLGRAGFVAAAEEAAAFRVAADGDKATLDALVERRLQGEPLAWITGGVAFCGRHVRVLPGVYVPRSHSELLARRATELLAPSGAAIDACTGCGAIAVVLRAERPGADVIATELDEAAARCATLNGVEVHRGDLLAPVPATWRGATDLVVAVVPYVPTPSLHLLQRDTFAFEGPEAYDGGDDGLALLRRIATEARTVLRPGGALLLELGGDQAEPFAAHLGALGYVDIVELVDDEGDTRGVEARRPPPP